MRQRKIPMRMCTGCGQMRPKKELVRIVKAPEKPGEEGKTPPPQISLDLTGKSPGRGAYLCRSADCLRLAFSCKIPEEVYDALEGELTENE